MNSDRVGIESGWLKYWNRQVSFYHQSVVELLPGTLENLQNYAAHGETVTKLEYPVDPVVPPVARWESFLPSDLDAYAINRLFGFEEAALTGGTVDGPLASSAFAASYTGSLIGFHTHGLFGERFPGRKVRMMTLRDVPFAALGFVIGAKHQATTYARICIGASREDYFFDAEYYPVLQFILRLLADQLGAPPISAKGAAKDEPVMNRLFDLRWGPVDVVLEAALLNACDFHTHRCKPTRGDDFREFGPGNWMRFPIEIQLLRKLRDLRGLSTPGIDHPLMATPLGGPLPQQGFQPDDLVERVRARMERDGYNEDHILARA